MIVLLDYAAHVGPLGERDIEGLVELMLELERQHRPHPFVLRWLEEIRRGPWSHASPSQIRAYRRCRRYWWLTKVARVPEAPKPWLAVGKTHHTSAENYLMHGSTPTPTIAAGIHFLPDPPVPAEHVEALFALWLPGWPVPVVGKIDLLEPGHRTHTVTFAGELVFVIGRVTDHKTGRSFDHALTAWELLEDPQGLIYALFAAPLFNGIDTSLGLVYTSPVLDVYPLHTVELVDEPIEFRHVLYLTPPTSEEALAKWRPDSMQTRTVLHREHLEAGLAELERDVASMALDAAKDDPRLVRPNPRACDDYGGCPMRGLCFGLGLPVLFGVPAILKQEE